MRTGRYIGNGSTKTISNIGFTPDLVLIKSDTTAGAMVFKSNSMHDLNTSYLTTATVDAAGIMKLNETGFLLTNSVLVNSANVGYS